MSDTTKVSTELTERATKVGLVPAQYKGVPKIALESWVAALEAEQAATARAEEAEAKLKAAEPESGLGKLLKIRDTKAEDFVSIIIHNPAISKSALHDAGFGGWNSGTPVSMLRVLNDLGYLSEDLTRGWELMHI